MNYRLIAMLAVLVAVSTRVPAAGGVSTRTVEYKDGDTVLEGWLAMPEGMEDKSAALPAVLIIHQWKGVSVHEKERAEMLAREGFIAFAADIYGKGVRAKDNGEAGKLAGQYKGDRTLLRRRVRAGLEALKGVKTADPARIFAIGYCFGGTSVLELARDGAEVAGVVSFHGGLDAPKRAAPGEIKCRVLVCHGADDPFVPAADVKATEDELRASGADWAFVSFGGAVHSFTDKGAGSDNSKGAAYNAAADKRSWDLMLDFFRE